MPTQHKWADIIKAWADGQEIQWHHSNNPGWQNWDKDVAGVISPGFNNPNILWRIKPKTIQYRRFLTRDTNDRIQVYILNQNEQPAVAEAAWGGYFLKWIDTEWQEVEV